MSQIEAYRALLEHRVVVRFDAAAAAGDLGGMAECARIMAEFRRGEAQLVQVRGALMNGRRRVLVGLGYRRTLSVWVAGVVCVSLTQAQLILCAACGAVNKEL